MEGYMLSIGYPVGVNIKKQVYEVELQDKIVELTFKEMQLWVKVKGVDRSILSKEENELLRSLVDKGVAFLTTDITDILEKLKPRRYVRQGMLGVDQNKISILLGTEVINIVKEQCLIWKFGDGNNSIGEVWDFISPKLPAEEYLTYIFSLMISNLIWII